MSDQFILTPFFLDEPLAELGRISKPDWFINQPDLIRNNQQLAMTKLYQPLRDFVARTLLEGNRPVSIAGDCCACIGVLAGLQLTGLIPTLIWFDAHGDFNTWETTPSGFLGGMPLAMIVGRGEQTIPEGVGLSPLPESSVILSDARDLDPKERQALAGSDVQYIVDPAHFLDMPLPRGSLYVHFDTDIISPSEAPAMNYLAEGGPTVALLSKVFRRIGQTGRLAAVSVSSWNPKLDLDDRTRQAVMSLTDELLSVK